MKQANAVITYAKNKLKYKEGTNNDTIFGKWYGLNHQPWCAMFVSWCFAQAGCVNLIAQTPKGFAGCQSFEAWAKSKKLTVPVKDIQAGDILLFDWYGKGISEHTGIALGYNAHTHLVDTIEGNTGGDNTGSQSNGDGVYLKHRAPSTIRCVVRPKWKE